MRGLEQGKGVALLISECQRGVIDPEMTTFPDLAEQVRQRGIIPRIGELARDFRAKGHKVVHLHVVHRPDYADLPRTSLIIARSVKAGAMRRGQRDVEPYHAQVVLDRERDIVHERSFSLVAFHGTELDSMLRNMGIQTLVLAGVSSNIAIPGCALAASDLGYQVIVAEDCMAGASAEVHAFTVRNALPLYATVSDSAQIMAALPVRT